MVCPKCNTPNEPNFQFCSVCGEPLNENAVLIEAQRKSVAREHLLSHTFRIVIGLIGLWLIKTILLDLSFVKELRIPELPISISNIILIIIFLIVLTLIFLFARTVSILWPIAFPKAKEAGSVWVTLLVVIALRIVYKILKPILQELTTETEPVMILQLVLLLVAIVLLFGAGVIIYRAIPRWFASIKEDWKRFDSSIQK